MDATHLTRWVLAAAAPVLLVACGDSDESSSATTTAPAAAAAPTPEATATLATADGAQIGTVTFSSVAGGTEVDVQLTGSNKAIEAGRFHGIHVHANADPANGEGCRADPAAAAATWFTAVDGHLTDANATHTDHKGDLPSVLVRKDGTASLRFSTDRFTPSEAVGKAVIAHASEDNFGNIPTGNLPDQYKASTEAASTKTKATGNAGDRMACGVITRS